MIYVYWKDICMIHYPLHCQKYLLTNTVSDDDEGDPGDLADSVDKLLLNWDRHSGFPARTKLILHKYTNNIAIVCFIIVFI